MTRHSPTSRSAPLAIAQETPDQPEVLEFFRQSEAYASSLYPSESNHFAPLSTLQAPGVVFLVARIGGIAVGCGAFLPDREGSAEIKRMWASPDRRGQGIGRGLLDHLIATARSKDHRSLRLETGIHQPEAIGLYRSAGFREIEPFGDYASDPLSLFMELALQA
jgi:putative acetyltransferase